MHFFKIANIYYLFRRFLIDKGSEKMRNSYDLKK